MANTFFQAEHRFGESVSLPVKADALAKSLGEFRTDSDVLKLNAGILVSVGADGAVVPAADSESAVGFLILNARGNDYENIPAYASGVVGVEAGGGVYRTNNVVEADIAAGDKLYVGTDGVISKTAKGSAIGVALTGNSSADKAIRFRAFI